jgi:hypothetical protein
VDADGTVYPFGDAATFPGPSIVSPTAFVGGIVPTDDGLGYWLFDAFGDVYGYGDAAIYKFSG